MGKVKIIELTIQNQLFQIKAEELKKRIWFHLNGKIFVLPQSGLNFDVLKLGDTREKSEKATEKSPGSGLARIHPARKEHLDLPSCVNKKSLDKYVIISPMPGQIVKILMKPGQEVKENQTVLILSSMKMEYTLKAPNKGFIKLVKIKEGDRVSADQVLMEITQSLEKT